MIFKTIPLSAEDPEIVLDAYIASPTSNFLRKAILVIPGGGYRTVCANREGEPIALAFLPYGYNAFVLKYSVGRKRSFPAQLIEASSAIRHIKDHSEEYGIDPKELFVTGFSAGGHLAACCGILWKHPAVYEALDMPYGYNKPKGILPIYAVINDNAHTFQNLWATDTPTEDQLRQVRLDLHVDADSVPAFMAHTAEDAVVPVQNSLDLAAAYAREKVPFELHIYPKGPHGLALANQITSAGNLSREHAEFAKWIHMAAVWMDQM